jgi:hypothetical protein
MMDIDPPRFGRPRLRQRWGGNAGCEKPGCGEPERRKAAGKNLAPIDRR